MIERLNWDSQFFGYPVGKLHASKTFEADSFIQEAMAFKLIYVFSEDTIQLKNNELVDTRIILRKSVSEQAMKQGIVEFDLSQHSYQKMLELTYLCGYNSRFKIDKNFKNNEFERLYKTWIDKSISKEIANHVLVKVIDKEIAGFLTINAIEGKSTKMVLMAVDEKHRGKNIATELIKECEYISKMFNIPTIEISTQNGYSSALKLYEKLDFEIIQSTKIYHYWNL